MTINWWLSNVPWKAKNTIMKNFSCWPTTPLMPSIFSRFSHVRELSQAELKKYEHKKEAVKELRKAYLEEKRRGIESREDVWLLDRFYPKYNVETASLLKVSFPSKKRRKTSTTRLISVWL